MQKICSGCLLLVVLCSHIFGATAHVPAVVTQHYNNARTGANTNEDIITIANAGSLSLLFQVNIEREICGQVLYVENAIGTTNAIYFWTNANQDGSPASLYGVDADNGTIIWSRKLNDTAQFQTETPVIDLASKTLFFVTKNYKDINAGDSGYGTQLLHAVDIATGKEKAGSPVKVDVSVNDSKGAGSSGGVVRFSNVHSNTRPGLLLVNGVIYIGYAYNSDAHPYHGWIFGYSYDQTKFTQESYFYTTPEGSAGGIWQGGKGLASDGQYVYCSVGNGDFDPSKQQWAMAVLKLTLDLKVADYYTVPEWKGYSNGDRDTGNAGPLLVPGTPYLFIGPTKYGKGHLLDTNNMGKWVSTTQDTAHQTITLASSVPPQPVSWVAPGGQIYIYVWISGGEIHQYKFDKTTNKMDANPTISSTTGDTGGGALSISSNGEENGILWALGFRGGKLYALDAADISKPPLWQASNGSDTHFGWVVVANGKVYSPTGGGGNPGNYLKVYAHK